MACRLSEGKFTIGGGTNSVAHFNDNTGSIDDDVTWVKGKHQIAFGGEWVQNQLNIGNAYEGNGIFTFNGEYSGSGPKGGSTIGDQNLDFLMGTLARRAHSSRARSSRMRCADRFPASTCRTPITPPTQLDAGRRPALRAQHHAARLLQSRRCVQPWPTSWPT